MKKADQNVQSGKAPGPDGIRPEMIKSLLKPKKTIFYNNKRAAQKERMSYNVEAVQIGSHPKNREN